MAKFTKIAGWVVTATLVLFIAGLAFIKFVPGYSFSLVRSGSMVPTLNVGDVIVTGPVHTGTDNNVKAGTIVMYQHNSETISHRIVAIDGSALITKGDAMQHADSWAVSLQDVKGVYLFKIPLIGYIMYFTQTKLGWFLMIIIPAAAIVGFLIKDILKEAFKDDKKPANAREVKSISKQNDTEKSA